MTLGFASRASSLAIASGLLVAGCMAGENTASKTDPGTGTDVVAAGSDDGADTGGGGSNVTSLLTVTDLASDQAGQALNVGGGLMNAWGIVSFNGMLWVANEGSGKVSIFDGEGKAAVAMPDKPGMIASDSLDLGEGITGIAVNDMAKPDDKRFQIHMDNGVCQPAQLIFASTKGMLIGVNPDLSTTKGFTLVDRSGSQAAYLGVAVVHGANGPMVLAADFHNGVIDVFDANFQMGTGVSFVNKEIPADFAPFNVMAFGDIVYVTYAQQDEDKMEEVTGPGLGFVAAFDTSGKMLWTLKSDSFNAPWGMAIAKDFGPFPGALLVGNFGDGHITAIDAKEMKVLGQLMMSATAPVEIDGLWGLTFGDGVASARAGLYFAAGPDDEMHGLFGVITAATNPPPK
ncbi:MAG TPA: TIGR03118 family protein [Kofleriaceae bacterium]|nr:TIGR03118 family protein [Kofleriaceae bacterium]